MEAKATVEEALLSVGNSVETVSEVSQVRCAVSEQTHAEEWVNVLTHGGGLLFAIVGAAFLLLYALQTGSLLVLTACSIYGLSMVFLFGASTLYHAAEDRTHKEWYRVADHICIYFLIAGTYTPFGLLFLKEGTGFALVWTLWGMALLGSVSKIVAKFRGWKKRGLISTGYYLLMGWTGLLVLGPLEQTLPMISYDLLIWGGYSYSIGTIFYMWRGLPHAHGIWHLFVLAGAGTHFFAVYLALGV